MRIVFMGTTPFSCVVLQQLLDDKYDVVGVVTQPDRPFGRKQILKPSPIKELALLNNLVVLQPESIRKEYQDVLDLEPDLIVTCAYGQIVPKVILDYPNKGCLNVHASLLPKFRGGAPIHWSIIRGETETGVTLMHMDVGMDSGDMIAKQSVSIEDKDTMGDVEAKLMKASQVLIHEDLKKYLAGELTSIEQDEAQVTLAYTIKKEDEFISFNRPVKDVYNHIRGLVPWPVGYGILDEKRVKLHAAEYQHKKVNEPAGTILKVTTEGIEVACIDGIVILKRLQTEGKQAMDVKDIANGVGRDWTGKVFL